MPAPRNTTKILIVEDDPVVLHLCRNVLKRNSFEPITAINGREGLDVYLAMGDEIALTISDVNMPEMDGIALVRQIFAVNPKSNVILMTGYSGLKPEDNDLAKLCSILQKPFSPVQLVAAVEKCLDYQERAHPVSR